MDTLILLRTNTEKIATSLTGLAIAFCLLLSQGFILAKDIGISTGFSPGLNYIKPYKINTEKDFDEYIKDKYFGEEIKNVDKGIRHIKMRKFYNGKPVRINIIELSKNVNKNIKIEPSTADSRLSSKKTISKLEQRKKAIVAINGGYFKPESGIPLGTLMINKKLYTGPIYDRVAIGFFDNGYDIARVKLNAYIETNIGGFKIDNINQPRMLSTNTIVYTPTWGEYTPPTPKYGKQLVIENNKISSYSNSINKIPQNGYVIIGPEEKLDLIKDAKEIKLETKINPNWNNVNHIISGGPYIIKNSEIYIDINEEKLTAISGRNPRTAIGYTDDNHLILITADGREGASVGLTLRELATLMKELGCINAINLDGGSSTVMYVNGKVVNKPPIEGGIPISHTLNIIQEELL